MPSDYTPSYKLSQWEKTDPVLMEDFNRDNAAIDKALRTAADALIGKGNCEIQSFTYRGTGGDKPTSFEFPKLPLFSVIIGSDGSFGILLTGYGTLRTVAAGTFKNSVSWSGNTVSWRATDSSVSGQLNISGNTYYVFAFYKMEQEE